MFEINIQLGIGIVIGTVISFYFYRKRFEKREKEHKNEILEYSSAEIIMIEEVGDSSRQFDEVIN
ncbi:MAG: hypothetical protein P1P85_02620 [Patescibacteria group bacterium]|nr:hypothetical protein [Patescibacteria group bacterium]